MNCIDAFQIDQYIEKCMTKRSSRQGAQKKEVINRLGNTIGIAGKLQPIDNSHRLFAARERAT